MSRRDSLVFRHGRLQIIALSAHMFENWDASEIRNPKVKGFTKQTSTGPARSSARCLSERAICVQAATTLRGRLLVVNTRVLKVSFALVRLKRIQGF
jgi:hypothetical protein